MHCKQHIPLPIVLFGWDQSHKITSKRGMLTTLSFELSLTLTLLLDEIHACPTTLCGFYFQSVHSQ